MFVAVGLTSPSQARPSGQKAAIRDPGRALGLDQPGLGGHISVDENLEADICRGYFLGGFGPFLDLDLGYL